MPWSIRRRNRITPQRQWMEERERHRIYQHWLTDEVSRVELQRAQDRECLDAATIAYTQWLQNEQLYITYLLWLEQERLRYHLIDYQEWSERERLLVDDLQRVEEESRRVDRERWWAWVYRAQDSYHNYTSQYGTAGGGGYSYPDYTSGFDYSQLYQGPSGCDWTDIDPSPLQNLFDPNIVSAIVDPNVVQAFFSFSLAFAGVPGLGS